MSSVLKPLKKVYSVFEWIAKCLWYASGASIVLIAILATVGAVSRYVFRAPIAITYDLTCWLMLISAMCCLPHIQCQKANLRLDLFDKYYPPVVANILNNIIAPILSLLFSALLTKECWGQATFALEIGEITKGSYPIPSFPLKMLISVCTGLVFLILLLQFIMSLLGDGKTVPDKSSEE